MPTMPFFLAHSGMTSGSGTTIPTKQDWKEQTQALEGKRSKDCARTTFNNMNQIGGDVFYSRGLEMEHELWASYNKGGVEKGLLCNSVCAIVCGKK